METDIMLSILNKIRSFVVNNSLSCAKDLTRLELDNLKGITEENCKSAKYYFYDL